MIGRKLQHVGGAAIHYTLAARNLIAGKGPNFEKTHIPPVRQGFGLLPSRIPKTSGV
jgi:hypothetical protein